MKSKKYSRKKNYCASSGSGTRRRFRGGSARAETEEDKKAKARDKVAEEIGKKRIYNIKTQDDENYISDDLKSMEKGQDSVYSEIKMSDAEEHYKKLAKQERAKEEKELAEESAIKKSKMDFLKDADKVAKFPEAINRSIKLKNVKIPSGKKRRTFENGTSVETNDKRLRRLLSQITEFTEPGDDITLENVDLDFDGHKKMFELSEKYGDKAIQRGLELISLAVATITTRALLPLFVVPLANPILQYFKSELTGVIGLFRFNMGLVLQIVETIYESQNRLRRLKNKESYERFNVDDSKRERTIEKYAKHQAIQGKADAMKLNKLIKDAKGPELPSAEEVMGFRQPKVEERVSDGSAQSSGDSAMQSSSSGAAGRGGAKNKTRAKSGGGGTQLPYDQYADTGYNTGTSFFAFEGDMGGRFDNTFTPTAEQSSFFKSIDYYDKV